MNVSLIGSLFSTQQLWWFDSSPIQNKQIEKTQNRSILAAFLTMFLCLLLIRSRWLMILLVLLLYLLDAPVLPCALLSLTWWLFAFISIFFDVVVLVPWKICFQLTEVRDILRSAYHSQLYVRVQLSTKYFYREVVLTDDWSFSKSAKLC